MQGNSDENNQSVYQHLSTQLEAVNELLKPEYRSILQTMVKFLQLRQLMSEISPSSNGTFHISSIPSSSGQHQSCDLQTFIRAVSPACNDAERNFLYQLQNTRQTLQMLETLQAIQNLGGEPSSDNFLLNFLTPSQQSLFKQFQKQE